MFFVVFYFHAFVKVYCVLVVFVDVYWFDVVLWLDMLFCVFCLLLRMILVSFCESSMTSR